MITSVPTVEDFPTPAHASGWHGERADLTPQNEPGGPCQSTCPGFGQSVWRRGHLSEVIEVLAHFLRKDSVSSRHSQGQRREGFANPKTLLDPLLPDQSLSYGCRPAEQA